MSKEFKVYDWGPNSSYSRLSVVFGDVSIQDDTFRHDDFTWSGKAVASGKGIVCHYGHDALREESWRKYYSVSRDSVVSTNEGNYLALWYEAFNARMIQLAQQIEDTGEISGRDCTEDAFTSTIQNAVLFQGVVRGVYDRTGPPAVVPLFRWNHFPYREQVALVRDLADVSKNSKNEDLSYFLRYASSVEAKKLLTVAYHRLNDNLSPPVWLVYDPISEASDLD